MSATRYPLLEKNSMKAPFHPKIERVDLQDALLFILDSGSLTSLVATTFPLEDGEHSEMVDPAPPPVPGSHDAPDYLPPSSATRKSSGSRWIFTLTSSSLSPGLNSSPAYDQTVTTPA